MQFSLDRFGETDIQVDAHWQLSYLLEPSKLFGANGIRAGSDGLIYVAQLAGSRVSTLDPESGVIKHLNTTGGEIVGPDDLVFDDAGNLFITEYTENRVSMRAPNGATHILQGNIIGSNPITFHKGHLIAGECRPDARIMELDRNGGEPRIIIDHVPMTNAFEVGPDGKLYFPVMETNEIWRVNLDGSGREVVVGNLGVPDSVKFDGKGNIISTQVGSGQVLRINPLNGEREVLADIGPGLDNSTFVGDRLFVSHMTGSIHEIQAPGELREFSAKGLLWPMGVAASSDGAVYVADGSYAYARSNNGQMELVGMMFTPGFPGFHRGVTAGNAGEWIVTTSTGDVKRYRPAVQESELLVSGYDKLMGIACDSSGRIVFAESGAGRVFSLQNGTVTSIATGLDTPSGVAIAADGTVYVSDSSAGRVIKIHNGKCDTVLDSLQSPEGIAVIDEKLFIIDVSARELIECSRNGKKRTSIVNRLPVGAPSGQRKYLGPAGTFSGPMVSFAGLAVDPDGVLYVGADGNGSVMALHPHRPN